MLIHLWRNNLKYRNHETLTDFYFTLLVCLTLRPGREAANH